MGHHLLTRLERALRAIIDLEQLPDLIAVLGHEPCWEPLSPGAWLGPVAWGHGVGQAAVVGRHGAFTWFGVATRSPEHIATRIARHLATRGEADGVIALDGATRRAVVTVAFQRHPQLVIDLGTPTADVLRSLERLSGSPRGGALATAAQVAEVLALETPGKHFIRAFGRTLESFTDALPHPVSRRDRRRLALLQLTRVLFLYFVQSRGWLNGRREFLRQGVDHHLAQGQSLQRVFFDPLFFGTLNTRPAKRERSTRTFGQIPFLNGGLFEPHPLEKRYPVVIPSTLWRNAFDDLFDRFHFTVTEGTEGSIAPDMLGRVFEGVMEPRERKASGTYYTPSNLVRDVLEAGLAAVVAETTGVSDREAMERVAGRDPELAPALERIRILDPAVGSGAFLLWALEWLADVLVARGQQRSVVKRRILAENVFGVDINATAVSLTQLRLWLAVLADEQPPDPMAVTPLPNLDCLIRQGNTLIDPLSAACGLYLRQATAGRVLARLRRAVVSASGEAKGPASRTLRRAERAAMQEILDAAADRVAAELVECREVIDAKTLFGGKHGATRAQRHKVNALNIQLRTIRRVRRRLEREGELPWFHFESHFADLFSERGGFDLVVGNPPWVRAEQLPTAERRFLAERFRWWRTGGRRGFRHQPDLALAFLERALELTAPRGSVAFLVPAKLATAAYGSAARSALARETTIRAVSDLTLDHGASFDATTYPMAFVATKRRPDQGHRFRSSLRVAEAGSAPQATLQEGGPWIICTDHVRQALGDLGEHHRLGQRLSCRLGVKTGANAVFLNPPASIEPVLRRPAIRGRDVRPWRVETEIQMLWTHERSGRPRSKLPPEATGYFARHRSTLRARADYRGGPIWQVFRVRPQVFQPKVVWSDLSKRLEAAALPKPGDDLIPLNTTYYIACERPTMVWALTGWLNATWIRAAAIAQANPARGGYARFNAEVISSLPLPRQVLTNGDLIQLAQRAAGGASIQADLDRCVASCLGLSPKNRDALKAVVEQRAPDRR